jgi:beta-mannosidase
VQVASARRAVTLAPRSTIELGAAALFDGFYDLSYAYRFGPPSHDLVVATLRAPSGAVLAQAFHFPLGLPSTRELDVGLSAAARTDGDGATVVVRTRRFAQSIAVDVAGFAPDDAYFHLAPGAERTIHLRRIAGTAPLSGTLQPLNAAAVTKLVVT